jgi:sterol desaturase/sphingolipid hydroxylase (fatty acid hydroxylase superfamily)
VFDARAALSRLIGRIAYPAFMLFPVAALWVALREGASLSWAPYMMIAAAGLAVIVIERLCPYRHSWSPTAGEVVDDGAFMVFVQILLPLVLAWIVVWLTQRVLSNHGILLALWPASWPIWSQVLLKLATGDFLRYWLHRWSHEHAILWRLHAVHHAPRKLYSVNVFRFHPADKALQFLGDSLPFILLGVPPVVLAYYFVVYATSGFFQHSNCDLRLGWLNYLVSGPEVHRWHHSQLITESNHNYAHTLIVWDLLFGTYFWPRGQHVGRLGLLEDSYPTRFGAQLLAPFGRQPPGTNAATG